MEFNSIACLQMTINYMSGKKNDMFMERYGFSSSLNPWDNIPCSGNARIHLDSFLSVFNISGLREEYYHNNLLSKGEDDFVDGAVIAAARTLPTWSEGDIPPIPSIERKAARELQEECHQILAEFPTTSDQDKQILDSNPQASRTLEASIKYRLHRKLFIEKVIQALELYQDRILSGGDVAWPRPRRRGRAIAVRIIFVILLSNLYGKERMEDRAIEKGFMKERMSSTVRCWRLPSFKPLERLYPM
ncbi:hypothetical protein Taro_026843 [Colocasia esculenta]|uniref:Rubisco LSMT substrate-binding domain-containing protein n=1 Tax=Colocasia esculenta TaxID=4460 RepID=A0A843VSI4_COLES|nr:hypothetical protein [Colocasia esculenta]